MAGLGSELRMHVSGGIQLGWADFDAEDVTQVGGARYPEYHMAPIHDV